MSRVNPADLPGNMAVLGIVIEQPNDTVSHIGRCLGQRFSRARFARSTAHSSLPRLADRGRVRRTHLERGNDRSLDRYEATTHGIEAFRTWMFEMPSARPALREAMYGRIELCRLEDLARLIEMVRKEEAVSDDLYREAALRLRQQRLTTDRPDRLCAPDPRGSALRRPDALVLPVGTLRGDRRATGGDRQANAGPPRRSLMGEVLLLDGVWKAFDRGRDRVPVLEGVSLTVAAGEIVAVVGTRDQGKTTLLRVASGSLPADRGSVRLCDRELTGLSDGQLARVLRTEIGWAARTGPEVRVRVRDYVELPLATGRWLGWRERRLRVAQALKQLDLAGAAELRWGELSDWQRVLVELAQAVVGRPRVLLVDDVIDGLGLGKKQAAMEILRGFRGRSRVWCSDGRLRSRGGVARRSRVAAERRAAQADGRSQPTPT